MARRVGEGVARPRRVRGGYCLERGQARQRHPPIGLGQSMQAALPRQVGEFPRVAQQDLSIGWRIEPEGAAVRTPFTSSIAVAVFYLSCALPLEAAGAAEGNAAQAQEPSTPRVFLLDAKYLEAARQRLRDGDKSLAPALAQLQRDEHAALDAGPFSVVSKKVAPPSGAKHDYMSQAPYFWPNPDTTNGMPYVRRDGERNPEINRTS